MTDISEADSRISHACSLALGFGASGRADVLEEYQRERAALIEWVEFLQSAAAEVVQAYDECTGAEPSQSVLDRAIDVNLRKAAAGFDNFHASQQAKDDMEAAWGGWV